jgi:hypothetical protein
MLLGEGKAMARWEAERRLDYIDFRLMTAGTVGRMDLMRTFGISTPQASADLNEYARLYPGMMAYSKTARRYVMAAIVGDTRRGNTPGVIRAIKDLHLSGHPMGWK